MRFEQLKTKAENKSKKKKNYIEPSSVRFGRHQTLKA